VGDDISTDEIMPAGSRVLPFRSNIPEISRFVFSQVDETFYDRAKKESSGFFIVAGDNYGQGSSREHAAVAPRYLGLRVVIAKSFARIHQQNLANFGILALTFVRPDDHAAVGQGDVLALQNLHEALRSAHELEVQNETSGEAFPVRHALTPRQVDMVLAGSLTNLVREA
jgi:aconitate hydratase